MKKMYLLLSVSMAFASLVSAQQFSVDADFRNRVENGPNRNQALNGDKVTTNVFNRARMNFNFENEKFKLKFSPQDVRSWNATGSAAVPSADNTFGIADAWMEYKIDSISSIKVGRQALDYDNNRLLGHLDWTMQGRFFEAFKYSRKTGKNSKLDFVATYHNDGYNEAGTGDGGQTTKSMQLLHFSSKVSDKFKFSLLALNNVVDNTTVPDGDNDFITFGFNPNLKVSKSVSIYGSGYYQTGRTSLSNTIAAYEASLNIDIKPSPKTKLTLGGEILSGTAFDADAGEDNSFKPLYGTNHAHNGFMDYFYVGNGQNQGSTGLIDGYLKTMFKLSDKSILKVHGHYFAAAAETASGQTDLGTELDIVFVRKISKEFNFILGHSQFFAGELLDTPGNASYQGWSWAMLVFKPKFQ